jgi:hypothetical protein
MAPRMDRTVRPHLRTTRGRCHLTTASHGTIGLRRTRYRSGGRSRPPITTRDSTAAPASPQPVGGSRLNARPHTRRACRSPTRAAASAPAAPAAPAAHTERAQSTATVSLRGKVVTYVVGAVILLMFVGDLSIAPSMPHGRSSVYGGMRQGHPHVDQRIKSQLWSFLFLFGGVRSSHSTLERSRSSPRLVGVVWWWPRRGASVSAAIRWLRITHGAPATGISRRGTGDVGPSCPKRPVLHRPRDTVRYQRIRPGSGRYAQTGILDRVPPRSSGIEQRFPKPSRAWRLMIIRPDRMP